MRKIVLALIIILASVSFGFAASLKISELTETQTLTDDDLFLVSTYLTGAYTSKYIKTQYVKSALGVMTIANDTLWDAAGDLVYGTGANTGARLAIGAPYALLMTNAGATAPAWTYTLGATGTRLTKIWATDLELTNAPTIGGADWTTILQPLNDDLTTLSAGGTAGCVWGEKSDGSGIECKTTLNLQLDDSAAQFKDATDATKTMQLELGSITTGTNRTLTVPDENGTIALVKAEKLAVFNIPGTSDDGTVVDAYIPVASTITGVVITTTGAACSAVVDIWSDTYANFPATVADTITASAKPTLSTAQAAKPNISTWTTAIAADTVLRANLDSSDCAGNIQVTIYGTK